MALEIPASAPNVPEPVGVPRRLAMDDLEGEAYLSVLARLHHVLRPASYLEIGTRTGDSLAQVSCPSIAVDPTYNFTRPEPLGKIFAKPALSLFRMTSDAFFANHDPTVILNRPIDFAFLDGMHRCEFLLRDFFNTERHCRPNSVIALHDCLPVEVAITGRVPPEQAPGPQVTTRPYRYNWWTGDVWRTALLLRRARPDLRVIALDAALTGLILVTNLNPRDTTLSADYARHVDAMMSWNLTDIGIDGLFAELGVRSTNALRTEEQITAHFWL
jgi:hypothetical protein